MLSDQVPLMDDDVKSGGLFYLDSNGNPYSTREERDAVEKNIAAIAADNEVLRNKITTLNATVLDLTIQLNEAEETHSQLNEGSDSDQFNEFAEMIPVRWCQLFEALQEQGFSEAQSFELLKTYVLSQGSNGIRLT